MRFTWKETGDRVFDGPNTSEGLMGGFPYGVQQWLKRTLKLDSIDQLDVVGGRLAYYFLTIRQADHTLLPPDRFKDLTLIDFEVVPHVVTDLDEDGDCAECHAAVGVRKFHLDPGPGEGEPVPTGRRGGKPPA